MSFIRAKALLPRLALKISQLTYLSHLWNNCKIWVFWMQVSLLLGDCKRHVIYSNRILFQILKWSSAFVPTRICSFFDSATLFTCIKMCLVYSRAHEMFFTRFSSSFPPTSSRFSITCRNRVCIPLLEWRANDDLFMKKVTKANKISVLNMTWLAEGLNWSEDPRRRNLI